MSGRGLGGEAAAGEAAAGEAAAGSAAAAGVTRWTARTLVPGRTTARLVQLAEPLSLWGGFDPHDGTVVDRHHPALGRRLSGLVVAMAASRGSSSSSSVLAEAIRLGTAPAAFVLGEADALLAVGALAAAELYDVHVPVVACGAWSSVPDGALVRVDATTVGGPATIEVASSGH